MAGLVPVVREVPVTGAYRGRNPLEIVRPLLMVTLDVTVRLPVVVRVVPSKLRFGCAIAEVVLAPFAVRTRFADGVLIAENPGPAGPV
jgi:hypothetical protein